jgi:hypothetical protein
MKPARGCTTKYPAAIAVTMPLDAVALALSGQAANVNRRGAGSRKGWRDVRPLRLGQISPGLNR